MRRTASNEKSKKEILTSRGRNVVHYEKRDTQCLWRKRSEDGTCSSKSAKLRCHRHPPTLHRPNCLCLCNANFILHNSKVKNWSRGFACLSNRRVACAPRRWNGESGGGHASPKQSRVASRSVRGDTQRGREREREP